VRFVVSLWLLAQAGRSGAAPDYFAFQGSVQFALPSFGLPAPNPNDPIVGGFNVERATAVPLPSMSVDRQDYRVQRFHGFFASFGGIEVRADDFELRVYNDLPQGTNPVADVVTLVWASDLVPAPSPLYVNGTPRTAGQFVVSFLDDGGNAFIEPSLAALDLLGDFDKSYSTLGDTPGPTGGDVFGSMSSWSRLPGLPGDFDDDADVDGNDFLTWQQSVGTLAQGDLAGWKSYFGTSDETPEVSPVPEPACTSAAATIVALLAWVRQRRRGA
jgi:hypothetical protein